MEDSHLRNDRHSSTRFCPAGLRSAGWIALVALTLSWQAAPVCAQQQDNADFRIVAARDTSFTAGEGGYRVRMVAGEPVRVRVVLVAGATTLQREVFAQSVTDVSEFNWDGLDQAGQPVVGRVRLQFDVQTADGGSMTLALPLTIEATGADTVPLPGMPADTARIWKQQSNLPSVAALAAGLLTGAAAIALPSAVALDGRGAPIRFAIGGTLGVTGVLGFFAHRERQIDPEAVERNQLAKEAWRAARVATIEANREKRLGRVRVIAGDLLTESL